MGEERRIVLNLLAEKRITVEEAEQLLAALEGATETVSEVESADADSSFMDALPERLSKVFSEMVDAGQELPGRLSKAMESLLGGFGWSCRGVQAEKCFKDDVCSPDIHSIDFATRNGSIKVVAWDKPGYHVVARARVVGADSEEEAERRLDSAIRLVTSDGKVSIDCEDRLIVHSLSIEAYFPKDRTYDVLVHTRNGSITLENLNGGSLDARSSNGRITLDSIRASRLAAATSNGSVTASGHLGDASIETLNGRVATTLDYESDGHLTISTSNGSIRITTLNRPDVSYEVNAETTNGAIRVLDEDAEVRSELRSPVGTGRKVTALTGTGEPEGGGAKIRVDARASNGSISIESR